MQGISGLMGQESKPEPGEEKADSMLFSTAFSRLGVSASLLVPWEARAVEVGATRLNAEQGIKTLQGLWVNDKYMNHLDPDAILSLQKFFDFAKVQANRDIIRQDEYGNFMIVLLSGEIAVDRIQPWGERLRLAETHPGEVLGEMSLLDSGIRFSSCSSMSECEIAILGAEGMDDMLATNPNLAANVIALLARKLSLRLRVVSARLSEAK